MKAEVLSKYVACELSQMNNKLTKKNYQQYLFSVNLFLKNKRVSTKEEKGRINRSLQQLTAERRKLIEQKANLISEKCYDKNSKEHFESRIIEL